MPYVIMTDKKGREVDRYYTSRWKKKKARQEAGTGTNPGLCKIIDRLYTRKEENEKNKTILPGIHDEEAPKSTTLFMQQL